MSGKATVDSHRQEREPEPHSEIGSMADSDSIILPVSYKALSPTHSFRVSPASENQGIQLLVVNE